MNIKRSVAAILAGSVCVIAISTPAVAQARAFQIPAGDMKVALDAYVRQSGAEVIYKIDQLKSEKSPGVSGIMTSEAALEAILEGSDLASKRSDSGAVAIVPKRQPSKRKIMSSYMNSSQPEKGLAQEVSGAEADQGNGGGLTEIIVTAQKRGERLQDVPIAITAVTGDDLAKSNISLVEQIGRVTPGLVINRYDTIIGVYLRGIGTRYSYAGLESTVGNYIDDLYSARPSSAALDFVDIERIEVLKGPQGTLFGRNTAGGVVRVVTKDPVDHFEGLAAVRARLIMG
jgi:hypothetical protein